MRKNLEDCVEKSGCADSSAAFGVAELRVTHISGFERSQLLLLPEAVDDYVGADNSVRFIDAFVDDWTSRQLDLITSRRRPRGVLATRRSIS